MATSIISKEEDSLSHITVLIPYNARKDSKFLGYNIGNKSHQQNTVFNLNGNKIKCDDDVKLLKSINRLNWILKHPCKKSTSTKRLKKMIRSHVSFTINHSFILGLLPGYFCSEKKKRRENCLTNTRMSINILFMTTKLL